MTIDRSRVGSRIFFMSKINWDRIRRIDLERHAEESLAVQKEYKLPPIVNDYKRKWFLKRARIRGWKSIEEEEKKEGLEDKQVVKEEPKSPPRGQILLF